MNTTWGRHHRMTYVLMGVAALDGPPTEQGTIAVGNAIVEFMNLGEFPTDDDIVNPIWDAVWIQQIEDRKLGMAAIISAAAVHSETLRHELTPGTRQMLVALGLVSIAQSEGPVTDAQLLYVHACGKSLGVG